MAAIPDIQRNIVQKEFFLSDFDNIQDFLRAEYPEIDLKKSTSTEKNVFAQWNKEKKDKVEYEAKQAVLYKLGEQAQEIMKQAMMATMAEINRQVEVGENAKKEPVILGIKNMQIFRNALDELRVFTKQPRYYSPVALDQTPEGDMIKNPLEGVQIVLTHTQEDLEDDGFIDEKVVDVTTDEQDGH